MKTRLFTSLYVHVPFCRTRCDYCAFYSLGDPPPGAAAAYLNRLEAELRQREPHLDTLDSVFVGGGTPSALATDDMRRLLMLIGRTGTRHPGCEWTVECNPESLSPEKLDVLAAAGVNRVSLGIQSFREDVRKQLGRAGSTEGLPDLVARLRALAIRSVGADLMFGVPGQTPELWRRDLTAALELGIDHLSTYALTLEEGTRLARQGVEPVDEEAFLDMWEAAEEAAGKGGLQRYEISNFARDGHQCRHNLNAWYGGTYAGCGPAAASFDGTVRTTHAADLDAWIRGTAPEEDALPAEDRAREILAFGFRTVDGWDADRFARVTGFTPGSIAGDALRLLVQDGLLRQTPRGYAPTRRGLLLNDSLAEVILAG